MERKFYSEREKFILVSLVENHKNVIECKKTDGVSIRKKQEVWEKICQLYNSNDVIPREVKQLKKLWDNIKQKTRKSDSDKKNYLLKTGGGPPLTKDDVDDPIMERVRSIVPTINLEIENEYDSIAMFTDKDNLEAQASPPGTSALNDHSYDNQNSDANEKTKMIGSEKKK